MQCGMRTDVQSNPSSETCHGCGCDFLARPPRSYAELEGLLEELDETAAQSDGGLQDRLDAAASRWVIVLLGVAAIGLAAIVGLILFGR
jgi:hypothetical protein